MGSGGFAGSGIFPVNKSKALAKSADAAMENVEEDVDEGEVSPRKMERKQLTKSILNVIAPAASEEEADIF